MAKLDGSIVIGTALDHKGLEKDWARLRKKIQGYEADIQHAQKMKMPLLEQSKELGAALDLAKAKLHEMQNAAAGAYSKDQLAAQKETVASLQHSWDATENQIRSYDRQIQSATIKLDRHKEEAGKIATQLNQIGPGARVMSEAMTQANESARRFGLRMREVIRSALVFTLITQGLASFRGWMGRVIKSNDEAAAATARLKGALLTMAQPLVDVVIPAFVAFVDLLTRVATAIAHLMATLFGTTVEQANASAEALHKEASALEGTGKAAKSAGKSLAAFDEINKLSGSSEVSSGASGSAVAPDFNVQTEGMEDNLKRILSVAMLIGIALLTWKLPSPLTDRLGTFIGLLIAVTGGVMLAQGAMEAWNEGVSWDNIGKMLMGVLLLVTGLSAVLGATAGGIALVASGFVLLGVAIHDVLENGWTLENLFLSIAGLLAAGLGISIITGSWIPMLVAAIGGILLAITVLTGNGGQLIDNLKQIFQGLLTFVDGIMTGDMTKIFDGFKQMFTGVINTVLTVFGSLINFVIKGLNWLIDKINTISFEVPEWVPGVGGKAMGFNLPHVKEWEIPQLAAGAVIPPNRQFLAVLGDQTNGNNLEAPESLIRKIVQEESGGGMTEALLRELIAAVREGKILQVDRRELGRTSHDAGQAEGRRRGTNLAVSRG